MGRGKILQSFTHFCQAVAMRGAREEQLSPNVKLGALTDRTASSHAPGVRQQGRQLGKENTEQTGPAVIPAAGGKRRAHVRESSYPISKPQHLHYWHMFSPTCTKWLSLQKPLLRSGKQRQLL